MNTGGISDRIIEFCQSLLGHIRGGFGLVNIGASVVFAGISGTAIADVSSLGTILIPAMVDEGYDDDFAVAVTASSSVIGPIIPPQCANDSGRHSDRCFHRRHVYRRPSARYCSRHCTVRRMLLYFEKKEVSEAEMAGMG